MINAEELLDFLEYKVDEYNKPSFIETDPISIPHRYSRKEDIEVASFLTATISWGNRKAILKAGNYLMDCFGESPYDFILESKDAHIDKISNFYYRTFNTSDLIYFIKSLKNIYINHNGLETIFTVYDQENLHKAISAFRAIFFELDHPERARKHVSDPISGSAAKRIHMMLRWLVRNDKKGVDFGIWKGISPSILSIPLDLHSGNTARKLGLLKRSQNDLKAVMELDTQCRVFDPKDPSKYDFALFGLGVFENFNK